MMIILTPEQAAQFSGETTKGHALRPVMLADGLTYVLPVQVLADPNHATRREALNALPQREIADDEWLKPDILPEDPETPLAR
jgi:hypothetical protein